MNSDFQKMVAECKRWGVKVVVCDEQNFRLNERVDSFSSAPFENGLGYNTKTRTIYVQLETADLPRTGCSILHELAHIVVNKHPTEVNEVSSGMLAFEYHVNRMLRLDHWQKHMVDYGLGHLHDYGLKSPPGWSGFFQYSRAPIKVVGMVLKYAAGVAQRIGILDEKNRPTYQIATS